MIHRADPIYPRRLIEVDLPMDQHVRWSGEVPPQKWMKLYLQVLTKFIREKCMQLKGTPDVTSENGVPAASFLH